MHSLMPTWLAQWHVLQALDSQAAKHQKDTLSESKAGKFSLQLPILPTSTHMACSDFSGVVCLDDHYCISKFYYTMIMFLFSQLSCVTYRKSQGPFWWHYQWPPIRSHWLPPDYQRHVKFHKYPSRRDADRGNYSWAMRWKTRSMKSEA